LKKRLYERRSKKRDISLIVVHGIVIYLLLSWDFYFGDVFALAPGYMLTLFYTLRKRSYIVIILSAAYGVLWSLYYPTHLYLSPIFFIIFSVLSILYSRKRKDGMAYFFLFYILQLSFCIGFYNQFTIVITQFIQVFLYLIIFFHIRVIKHRR